ncbi:MAG TPA: prepilin-type N-terminal cleavage/methylation domain-containing protein [Gaiellaceae bacterium]|jgi:prepilin-type N-terminal cleavage/methylation domain-containing protein
MVARIRARLAREDGMTLPELLTTMAILGIVMTAILGVSVSGLHATTDLNQRFQAQQDGRVALTKMRNDVETACSASTVKLNGALVAAGTAGDTVTLDDSCVTGGQQVTWCATSSNGSAPFTLYRRVGATCTASTGVKEAQNLTTKADFTSVITTGYHPQLTVNLPLDANLKPGRAANQDLYTLNDTMMLRNAAVS